MLALTWLKTALMEWNARHTILAPGVQQTLRLTQLPLLCIKVLEVAISTRAQPAEDDPPLYK